MRQDSKALAARLFCILCGAIAVFLAFRYLFEPLLPFIAAWCVSLLSAPAVAWLARRTRLPRTMWTVLLLLLGLGGTVAGLYFAVDRLILESGKLLSQLRSWQVEDIVGMLDRLPLLGELTAGGGTLREQMIGVLMKALSGIIGEVGSWLSSLALRLATGLPSMLLALTVGVVACFYFTLDQDSIRCALMARLPERWRCLIVGGEDGGVPLRQRLTTWLGRWLRAYLVLFFMTFCELLLGFVVLGVDCALLVALLVAVVDLLPVLGTGAILLPWALWCFAVGAGGRGVGLVVLWGVITVVHQIAEPHVVGGSVGVHPLVSLVAMYVGFKLIGLPGLLIFPLLAAWVLQGSV